MLKGSLFTAPLPNSKPRPLRRFSHSSSLGLLLGSLRRDNLAFLHARPHSSFTIPGSPSPTALHVDWQAASFALRIVLTHVHCTGTGLSTSPTSVELRPRFQPTSTGGDHGSSRATIPPCSNSETFPLAIQCASWLLVLRCTGLRSSGSSTHRGGRMLTTSPYLARLCGKGSDQQGTRGTFSLPTSALGAVGVRTYGARVCGSSNNGALCEAPDPNICETPCSLPPIRRPPQARPYCKSLRPDKPRPDYQLIPLSPSSSSISPSSPQLGYPLTPHYKVILDYSRWIYRARDFNTLECCPPYRHASPWRS